MNHRNRTFAVVASLALVATAYGCSSSSSSGDDSSTNPDGGGTGTDGGGSGGDGGSSGDSGGGGGGSQYLGAVTVNPSIAAADFATSASVPSCVTTSGSCKIYNCPIDLDASVVDTLSAGDITITGGKLSSPFVLHYDGDAGIYGGTIPSTAFAAGDTLSISAAGDVVSSFSGSTGKGPGPITMTAPVGTGTAGFQSYTIDTTKDLTVTWTGGSAGTNVAFSMSNDDDESLHIAAICTFDGPGGTGTVPAAVLAQLGDPTSGTIEANPVSVNTVTGSNVSVDLQLTNEGTLGTWTKQ